MDRSTVWSMDRKPVRFSPPATSSMDAASSPAPADAKTVPIQAAAAQETLEALKERLHKTAERVETRISMSPTMIHKFPRRLRALGGEDNRYMVPGLVSIGPYHHGLPHLQEMEEVKHAVAYRMCRDSGRSVDDVYGKIVSIAGDARSCYAADDAKVKALSDAEFATMMFLDGCFLVWAMATDKDDPLVRGLAVSAGPNLLKDISMLENQIPWLVVEALMEFCPVDVDSFVYMAIRWSLLPPVKQKMVPSWIMRSQRLIHTFLKKCRRKTNTTDGETRSITNHGTRNFRPPHLLGLMRFILIHGMPPRERRSEDRGDNSDDDEAWPSTLSSSAVDLAQIGVNVTVSTAGRFADMNVRSKSIFGGELFLSPVFINDVDACQLVNLVALEAAGAASTASSYVSDGYVVSSYLSVLAMLMDSEEDVQELRRRGVLCSHFSNAQMLAFFKALALHLRLGYNYFSIVRDIQEYMHRRPVRIAVHKFVYNNYKLIVAVLSIASVLVGIFRAIYSLKQP